MKLAHSEVCAGWWWPTPTIDVPYLPLPALVLDLSVLVDPEDV